MLTTHVNKTHSVESIVKKKLTFTIFKFYSLAYFIHKIMSGGGFVNDKTMYFVYYHFSLV